MVPPVVLHVCDVEVVEPGQHYGPSKLCNADELRTSSVVKPAAPTVSRVKPRRESFVGPVSSSDSVGRRSGMGRRSRARRQSAALEANPASALVEGYEPRSMLALLEAASASPTAAHRNLSLGLLAEAVVRRRGTGRRGRGTSARTACAADVTVLVAEVARLAPELAHLEDFAPFDNRPVVLVRWGAEVFRLMAGALERPVAVVNDLSVLARVVDRVVIPAVGFGLADVVEVVLRRVDQVADALVDVWPDGAVANARDDARVTQAEVDAVAALAPFTDLPALCSAPDRALAAVNHFTVTAQDLVFDPSEPVSVFGQTIAARVRGTTVALPAVMQLEALQAIGAELARVAVAAHPRVEQAYQEVINRRVTSLLVGSGHKIAGEVRLATGERLHSVVVYNERQVLALNVASGLTPMAIGTSLARGDAALSKIRPGVELRTPNGSLRLRSDAQIARLNVVAGTISGVPLTFQHPFLALMDLEWIRAAVQESRNDLWYFVRDLDKPAGVRDMFSCDQIDKFQVWRGQKTFYRGGRPIDFIQFTPHESVAEWRAAARNAPAERALQILGLPPLRDWPLVDIEYRGGVQVGDLGRDLIYQVVQSAVPVAVSMTDRSGHRNDSELLWNLATALAWKIVHIMNVFVDAARASGRSCLHVHLHHDSDLTDTPLAFHSLDGDVLSLCWGPTLQTALAADSYAVERQLGELVALAVDEQTRPGLVDAWTAAPPGIRIDGYQLPQRAQWLPDPFAPHQAVRSVLLRQLGEHLAAEGIEPGTLEGDAARDFESRTVFPWLRKTFHKVIAPLDGSHLLTFALAQLEQATRARNMLEMKSSWQQGFPVREQSSVEDNLQATSQRVRIVAFVVEEVLAHPPAGRADTDELTWIEAITAAEMCLDSCLRSDSLHHQLTHTTLELNDTYELDTEDSIEPTDIDLNAYQRVRNRLTRPDAVPISTGIPTEPPAEEAPQAVLDAMPELAPIDNAMRSTLGFGIDALVGVLNVATQWEASSVEPVTIATADEIVTECTAVAVGAEQTEYAAAVDWLTLRADDLRADTIAHWETERRAKRVTTRPLIATPEGLAVLPWASGATLRVVANYLSDGRLPWPSKVLPQPVNAALDTYRQNQNRQAEKTCAANLTVPGLIIRPSLKPAKAAKIGITSLSGEIDVLCIDPAQSRIWVVEVKDSYTPFSPYQIRRLVDAFDLEGKYVDKLLAKAARVSACATTLAAALHIDIPDRLWKVHALMALKHPEPAAYTVQARVSFCLVDDVLEIITSDGDPSRGPNLSLVPSEEGSG